MTLYNNALRHRRRRRPTFWRWSCVIVPPWDLGPRHCWWNFPCFLNSSKMWERPPFSHTWPLDTLSWPPCFTDGCSRRYGRLWEWKQQPKSYSRNNMLSLLWFSASSFLPYWPLVWDYHPFSWPGGHAPCIKKKKYKHCCCHSHHNDLHDNENNNNKNLKELGGYEIERIKFCSKTNMQTKKKHDTTTTMTTQNWVGGHEVKRIRFHFKTNKNVNWFGMPKN